MVSLITQSVAIFPALLVLCCAAAAQSGPGNLIVDSGFETPVVGPGGYGSGFQVFDVGTSFGPGNGWTVIGSPAGNVAIYPDTERAPRRAGH